MTGVVRAYMYIEQLAEVTPWSPQAIRTMVTRGVLREGEHFFRPGGHGTRMIFSWEAIVKFIEGNNSCATNDDSVSLANGAVIRIDEEADKSSRMHA